MMNKSEGLKSIHQDILKP